MARLPVTTLARGHTTFQYRQNASGQWEERGPLATGWSRVRTSWPEETVRLAILRLEAQGFTKKGNS
jgi:hypothetical protein